MNTSWSDTDELNTSWSDTDELNTSWSNANAPLADEPDGDGTETSQPNPSGYLGIGEMAKLNCISAKSLRIYHQMGLLEPVKVDPETGYRFYSLDQCATIDVIQQLQTLGATLTEIKELFDTHDPAKYEELLLEHQRIIEEEALTVAINRHNVQKLIGNYHVLEDRPVFDEVILERMPERFLINFPMLNPRSVAVDPDGHRFLREWELNLRLTKREMIGRNIPVSLFHCVGCRIAAQDLEQRTPKFSGSFITIRDRRIAQAFDAETVPEGTYLTMYRERYSAEDGRNLELDGIMQLLDYIEAHGYTIAGDYLGEIIAESPVFLYTGREMLFKQEIPVTKRR